MAEQEIARLELLKTQEQAKLGGLGDGMPRAPGVSDTTYSRCQRAIDLYDSEIALQQRMLNEAHERLERINLLLSLAGSFKARTVLFKHYCEGKTWDCVGDNMHYAGRHVKRIGSAALEVVVKKCPFHVPFFQ